MRSVRRFTTLTPVIFASYLIIAGCASTHGIAPHAKPVDAGQLDVSQAVRAASVDAQWPNEQWWKMYLDPQLDQWIADALAGSPSLAMTRDRVRQAQAIAGVAQADLSPQLNGNLSITRQHWPDNVYYGPGPLAHADTWNNTIGLSLSYSLDLWGHDEKAAERALDAARMQAVDARAAQLELAVNIVRAYIKLSLAFAQRDIAAQTLAHEQSIVDIARRRLQGGIGTQLELTQAQAPLPQRERQIAAFDEQIALLRNQLAALAGKGPGAGAALQRPTLSLQTPVSLPSNLPAELLGHRPDVVAARWRVAANAAGVDVARTAFYPNVNLLASVGAMFVGGGPLAFLLSQAHAATVGPAISLPIFNGGRLRAQLDAASAGYDLAVDQYNQTLVDALKDIADQIVTLKSLDIQQDAAQRAVAVAQRSYDLASTGFRRGLTDYLSVLSAQTQLLQAQQDAEIIHASKLAARASLTAALGGGRVDPGDGPSDEDPRVPKAVARQASQ
ncbi:MULTISPECIES: efflux transporter outer membrane subunit [Burkholderiaceae]|uniref:efflux transporter outer membrane subunit n=1 Tax=Burkholderiaceae TaxID=119060 RepID=UPI000967A37C|nr:efflux transporter outer membrane subunit [Burkholderia sp. b13]MCG1018132.1 efflux transporter outer membrane subunit [Mycetohabitans sp. B4]SIT67366.1 efflux transporter, outer membrane factor (OMF) lipoprotein, NodT family [Burkholderia sp. b13]